jgi:hypothetical protein
MVVEMFSCVTCGSTTPGVQIGSGSPLTEWQCAVETTTPGAATEEFECDVSAMPSVIATTQTVSKTRKAIWR